ncbi:hypothetical protein ACJVDH_18165 [Pedobacter sp. AW1-32]|uniref:hypothetical protein n=1 Tax=Pedobacter sp. AW1-32 TaxID=3383026 RepID=UPI003FEEA81C
MGKEYLIDTNTIIDYLDNKIGRDGMLFMHPIIDRVPNRSFINKTELLGFNTTADGYQTLLDFTNSSNVVGLTEEIIDSQSIFVKCLK